MQRQPHSFRFRLSAALAAAVLLLWGVPSAAQIGERELGVDYIILIDASYSMLLDPRNPSQAANEVGKAIREFEARTGTKPNVSELSLRSGLFKRVISVANQLLQSATDDTTVAVYAFNDRIVHSLELDLSETNRLRVADFLQSIAVGGDGTAIFSSVNEALDRVEKLRTDPTRSRKSTIFLFTDGKENVEDISIDEILDRFGLLRADDEHFLFWRYYYPQAESSTAAKEEPDKPKLLEDLEERGVELYDLSDLDQAFDKESIDVEPRALRLSAVFGGKATGELTLATSDQRTEPVDLHLSAEFPGAAADGIRIRADPQATVLSAENGRTRLEVTLHVEHLPGGAARAEPGTYEGVLRLTSPQVTLFRPSRVPVTLHAAESGPQVIASVTPPETATPVVATCPLWCNCLPWCFFALAALAVATSWALLHWGPLYRPPAA